MDKSNYVDYFRDYLFLALLYKDINKLEKCGKLYKKACKLTDYKVIECLYNYMVWLMHFTMDEKKIKNLIRDIEDCFDSGKKTNSIITTINVYERIFAFLHLLSIF